MSRTARLSTRTSQLAFLTTTLLATATLGSPAASAAEVFAARDQPTIGYLSEAETVAVAGSVDQAASLCDTELRPAALQFHTANDWQFPACAVAVHDCANRAFDNGKLAVVRIYSEVYDCAEWTGDPAELPQ